MLLPNGGRIIIIDNDLSEATPLINALNKRGMPCMYFDGNTKMLPDEPVAGTRFVFLDIELAGMTGQSDKNIVSGLLGVLDKVIGKENGPYVIIFWTKHPERIDGVLDGCKKREIAPIGHVSLDKTLIGDPVAIWNNIKTAVESKPAFQLINQWENAAHSATISFVNAFCKHFDTSGDWSEQASRIFYMLYKASAEKQVTNDTSEQLKYALVLLNRSYSDTLESSIKMGVELPAQCRIVNGEISADVVSKINTSLIINADAEKNSPIGSVYMVVNNDELKNHLAEVVFKNGKRPNEFCLCQIVITPECDYAQSKLLKGKDGNNEFVYHRIVHALMWKWAVPYVSSTEFERWRGRSEATLKIDNIYHANSIQTMVCHFSSLSYCRSNELAGDPVFSLRRELLADLQTKSANHVNRLGNTQLPT